MALLLTGWPTGKQMHVTPGGLGKAPPMHRCMYITPCQTVSPVAAGICPLLIPLGAVQLKGPIC
jgi:hypothetical protein